MLFRRNPNTVEETPNLQPSKVASGYYHPKLLPLPRPVHDERILDHHDARDANNMPITGRRR